MKFFTVIQTPEGRSAGAPLRGFSVIICLLLILASHAQLPIVRNFSPSDYQGSPKNWNLALSRNGYIFTANNAGLLVYSGQAWDQAKVPNHTDVHSVIYDDSTNRFYTGAFEEFGYFTNQCPLGSAPYESLAARLPESVRDFRDIWSITSTPDGEIVFAGRHHLFIYDPGTEKVSTVTHDGNIQNLTTVGDTVYVSSDWKIYTLSDGRLHPIPHSDEIAHEIVAGVYREGDQTVFVTHRGGWYTLTSDGFSPAPAGPLRQALGTAEILTVVSDPTWLAVGTVRAGLYAMERKSGRVYHMDRTNGLRNNTVLDILPDTSGNLWAALDNGLSYVIFDSPFKPLYPGGDFGTGFASATMDGYVYLGTNQGVYRMPVPDPKRVGTRHPARVEGVSGQVWGLRQVGDELLCAADAGVFVIRGDRAYLVPDIGGTWSLRAYPGRHDLVIAAVYDGFAVLERASGSWRLRNRIAATDQSGVNFEIDSEGRLWYSHWLQGVYCLTLTDDLRGVSSQRIFNAANQLPTDDNNLVTRIGDRVYISAADGFHRLSSGGALSKVDWLTRLFPPKGISTRVIETDRGDLWGFSPGQLCFASRSVVGSGDAARYTYTPKRFTYTSTLERLQMNLGHLSTLPDGMTLMNYDEGFYIVDPASGRSPGRISVGIDYVRTRDGSAEGGDFLFRSELTDTDFSAGPDQRDLLFTWSAPEYSEEGAILFSHFIEGYDRQWSSPSPETRREVTRIGPGDYIFRLKAVNTITGEESESVLPFRVRPAWYETWWARVLFVLVLLGLGYVLIDRTKRFVKTRIDNRRRQQELLEHERQEKARLEAETQSARQHNEQLTREIKRKSSELADSDLHYRANADTLRNIDSALAALLMKAQDGADASQLSSEIRTIRKDIRMHAAEEADLDRLHENFNIIFDDLLGTLAQRYPSLSQNDITLCSYLKLNLPSKQIAALMNLSERSVESNRYRLRKKLGMASGESFSSFFNSLNP